MGHQPGVDIRGQPLGQFEGAAHGRVFALDSVMARHTSQAGMHLGQHMCAGRLGLWALFHGGGLICWTA
jgi:hypothetical protein